MLPMAAMYAFGNWCDRRFTTPRRAKLPAIVVGNVVAGGSGKTPTAIALAKLLASMGETPHIVSRGYGGQSILPSRVEANDSWHRVGDEALLLAKAAPTWVGRDRLASTTAAWEQGASLAICDDALQHYPLQSDLAFLVIDGAYGFGNEMLFPAGPLREPVSVAYARTDAIILIGEDKHDIAGRSGLPVFAAEIAPSGDTAFLRESNWLAFAGLARPEKFFKTLYALGAKVTFTRDFPDHHPYTDADLAELTTQARASNARLITTEKDAVKLPSSMRDAIAILPVTLRFADEAALGKWLSTKLKQLRNT